MAEQKDIIAGLDLSPLSSVSQENLMQAINGASPLSNIGFVIASSTRPDVTNNSRFIRYIWLDISVPSNPVFKRYVADRTTLVDADASWEALGVATGAILTAMLAARSATGGVDVARLKLNSDYSASLASQYYILRVAANGKDIEAVSLDTLLTDGGGVDLDKISLSGSATSKYLRINASGALEYAYLNPTADITSSLGNRIPVTTAISPGTALYLLRTNSAGTACEWVATNTSNLFTDGDIAIAKLATTGAVEGDVVRFNDSGRWAKSTPKLDLGRSSTVGDGVSLGAVATNLSYVHALGVRPKIVRAVFVMGASTELGYAEGDEVDIFSARDSGSNAASVSANSTTIYVTLSTATGLSLPNRGTGVYAAMTEANWTIKIYAYA